MTVAKRNASGEGKSAVSRGRVKRSASKLRPAQKKDEGTGKKGSTKRKSVNLDKKARPNGAKIFVVVLFAVIMVLGMVLPYMASAIRARQSTEQSSETTESSTETTESSVTLSSIADVDDQYQPTVSSLEEKLESNPDDLTTLLGLAGDYQNWAATASQYITYDDEGNANEDDVTHIKDLYGKAVEYYDRYIELNDSSAARTNRAMCKLYTDDAESGYNELVQLTEEQPDYAPAWLYLGVVDIQLGNTDAAKEELNKAVENDENDEYGAKTKAQVYLSLLEQQESEAAESSDATESSAATESSSATEE